MGQIFKFRLVISSGHKLRCLLSALGFLGGRKEKSKAVLDIISPPKNPKALKKHLRVNRFAPYRQIEFYCSFF